MTKDQLSFAVGYLLERSHMAMNKAETYKDIDPVWIANMTVAIIESDLANLLMALRDRKENAGEKERGL